MARPSRTRAMLLTSEADPEDALDIADLRATRWSLEVSIRPPHGTDLG